LAISRERKEELIAYYGDLLGKSTGFVVTEYKGLTDAQLKIIRGKLRDVQGKYVITKNTLFMRALADAGWPVPEQLLVGPTAVVVGGENFPTVAKTLMATVKDYEEILKVKGGVMAGSILTSAAQVEAVSNLPSLDELRAQLAGLIVQPATGLVSVVNAVVAGVPQVVQAYLTKQEAA
jgi:large subunit ribosomal protein L10